MLAYGAKFELTPRAIGMPGAIERAKQLVAQTPGAWMPQQFDNPANIDVHVRTTAQEVLRDFPEGLDAVITGVGTGGHITATGAGAEADMAAAESLCGRTGCVAGDFRRQAFAASDSGHRRRVHSEESEDRTSRRRDPGRSRRGARDGAPSAREEGVLVGISSGAALAAIAKKLPELKSNARVLGFNYDTGERYLSIEGFLPAEVAQTI